MVCSTILLGPASEKESVRIGVAWRTMFFGMFRLTFTPPLNVIHIYFFIEAQFSSRCSNAITTFATSSFDPPSPADLNMEIYITCLCNHRRYFPVSSHDECTKALLNPTSPSLLSSPSSLLNMCSLWPRRNQKPHMPGWTPSRTSRCGRAGVDHRWFGISLD